METPAGAQPAPGKRPRQRQRPGRSPACRRGAESPKCGSGPSASEPPICGSESFICGSESFICGSGRFVRGSGSLGRGSGRLPPKCGAGRGAAGRCGAGGAHPRGADPELPAVPARGRGAALVGGHRHRHAVRPRAAAAAAAARPAPRRPPLPAPAPAPAPLPAAGAGPPRHRPVPGGPGVLGAGGLSEETRREPAEGLPGAPGADAAVRVVLPGASGHGGGAAAGAARGGLGLGPRPHGPRPALPAAAAGHRLHLPRPGAGGGSGRGQPGGGANAAAPPAPPPRVPAVHRQVPRGRAHLLADVQRLQPIADGAAARPRPEGVAPHRPAPRAGPAPRRPRPPGQTTRAGDPGAAPRGVGVGACGPTGGGARAAAAPTPGPGGQRSPASNVRPEPPGAAAPPCPGPPETTLERDAGAPINGVFTPKLARAFCFGGHVTSFPESGAAKEKVKFKFSRHEPSVGVAAQGRELRRCGGKGG